MRTIQFRKLFFQWCIYTPDNALAFKFNPVIADDMIMFWFALEIWPAGLHVSFGKRTS